LAVLCSKRCMADDYDFVLATSSESSDDLLVKVLADNNIHYYRGSLDNVLERFIDVCKDLDDDDLIVRLTGDNPFVDAAFIANLVEYHRSHEFDYTRTLSPQDGLPYGLSGEVLTAGLLRQISANQPDAFDREHVTYSLTMSEQYGLYKNKGGKNLSHLRVTVDTFDDYIRVVKAFEKTQQWDAPVHDLIAALETLPETPHFRVPYKLDGFRPLSRLALGTVQLGLPYGVANTSGPPCHEAASQILTQAVKHGVNLFDTAAAYGESERVIGQSLPTAIKQDVTISTKLDPLTDLDESSSDAEIISKVENSVYKSLYRLGVKTLPVLMLHRWAHYSFKDGLIINTLRRLQEEGFITRLGVSVQSPEEGIEALRSNTISFIQMPFNIIDSRWRKADFANIAQENPGKHIQARSALLQGLLTLPAEQWPTQHQVYARDVVSFLDASVAEYNRSSVTDLCLAYVRSIPWIDSVVIGVEKLDQLQDNMRLFLQQDFTSAQVRDIDKTAPEVPDVLLNPALWRL